MLLCFMRGMNWILIQKNIFHENLRGGGDQKGKELRKAFGQFRLLKLFNIFSDKETKKLTQITYVCFIIQKFMRELWDP